MAPRFAELLIACLVAWICGPDSGLGAQEAARSNLPNFVVILTDDQGYGDLGCYGAKGFATPALDRMAAEGVRLTDFYVAQSVCSASRAAFLTGCYPNRIGILGALGPDSKIGISDSEKLLPQILKERGYATAIYGKWHLGDGAQFLPTRHGFDEFFGLPYSNDLSPKNPSTKYPDLPLFDQEKVVELNPDQTKLTTWYTERAVSFIERNKSRPFFLYVPHTMPHVPLAVSSKFAGKTAGLYGDVIEEIDWSVGEILAALVRNGLDEKTMVIFFSDNGPWLSYGNHAGSAGNLREGKATTFEGGLRVPCIIRWPGRIPAGRVSHEMVLAMDFLPTLAALAGAAAPADRKIDGRDIWPLLNGTPDARTPHETFFYYQARELQAVRSGRWKLHLPHRYVHPDPAGGDGKSGTMRNLELATALYDIESDPAEQAEVSSQHPEIVQRLTDLAEQARDDLGDSGAQREGRNTRAPGKLQETQPKH